ncbi:hypothetical protein dqs_1883 [Azoarcus olearius]|uniref:hypothetical protein n=1 Tax=Azoarcus sp. (strain BH72) TaxID=418699 RepID=UPI00080613F2|nr:hypothetical protein [Azoarcus olearius]ANQ84921.1 hypothetical protein dqs_1883 [Azoarcus olearius]
MHREHIGGLHELWLKNGYQHAGSGVRYQDPDGLVHAIGVELCRAAHRLAPDGVHFLRRLIERTQDELDALLDLPPGTVAACEAGLETLPTGASARLRAEALAALGVPALAVPDQTLAPAQKLIFAHDDRGWHCVERVVLPALLCGAPPGQAAPWPRRASR